MQNKNDRNGERIAKYLARAGIASRRDAEKLVEAGRVKVNGKVLTSPAFNVTDRDKIEFDDKPVAKDPPRLWRYHKPTGLLTTHKDPEGRPTVFENLPKDLPRVMSVGRLDMNSEGLLLLTNDGDLARALELPKTGFLRRYRARAYGKVDQATLDKLKDGIIIDGIPTGSIEATLERQQRDNAWILVAIREGKNREVRRALETVGLKVNRLIRLSYGPYQLAQLERGAVEEVKTRVLRDQLGHLIDIPEAPKLKTGQNTSGHNKPGNKNKRGSKSGGFRKGASKSAKPANRKSDPKSGTVPSRRRKPNQRGSRK